MGELQVRPDTAVGPYADGAELLRAVGTEMEAAGRTSMLVVWSSTDARARVSAGEWVADCPRGCNNAEFITDKSAHLRGVAGQPGHPREMFACSYCHHLAPISWPEHAVEITEILDRRPIPHTRNWWPEGHLIAIKAGGPHGQTPEDLLAENAEHGVA